MQPRADSLLTDLAHRVRLPAQLLVVLERCTLTLSRTRCPSPSGGSRVDGGRGSGARREQTNAAAYSRLWWRAAIRAAFQHSSLPSIRRARPVARPPVRARAHPRTVCLTFRHRHGGRVCQSRRLLRAVGLPFLPLNETTAGPSALSYTPGRGFPLGTKPGPACELQTMPLPPTGRCAADRRSSACCRCRCRPWYTAGPSALSYTPGLFFFFSFCSVLAGSCVRVSTFRTHAFLGGAMQHESGP